MKILKKAIIQGYGLHYPAYVIGDKFIFYKGLYNYKFSIEGLYHNEFERELLKCRKFEYNGQIVIRFRKFIFTYNKNGYIDNFKNMNIQK